MDINAKRALIKSTNGKWFSVVFKKANGSLRKLNGRLKVTKHLRGGISTTRDRDNLITVYDIVAKGYRNVNLETLEEFTFKGTTTHF